MKALLHERGFRVDYPGQISPETIDNAFREPPLDEKQFLNNPHRINTQGDQPPKELRISRFSPTQTALIDVAHMAYFDIMRGITHPPRRQSDLRVLGFAEKIEADMLVQLDFNEGSPCLYEAVLSATEQTITDFDENYPKLTRVLKSDFEVIGARGIARAVIKSSDSLAAAIDGGLKAKNINQYHTRRTHRSKFERYRPDAGSPLVPTLTVCLGRYIAMGIIADTRTAAVNLAQDSQIVKRYDREKDLRVDSYFTAETNLALRILSVFPGIGHSLSSDYTMYLG